MVSGSRKATAFLCCVTVTFALSVSGCKKSDQDAGTTNAAKSGDEIQRLEKRGGELVRQMSCTSCHSQDGSKKVASSFMGMFGGKVVGPNGKEEVRDEAYIRKEIISPSPMLADGSPSSMPKYDNMSEESLQAIVYYIRSLGQKSDG